MDEGANKWQRKPDNKHEGNMWKGETAEEVKESGCGTEGAPELTLHVS